MRRIENYYAIKEESEVKISDDKLGLSPDDKRDGVHIENVNYSYNNSLYSFLANELSLLYNNVKDIENIINKAEAGGGNDQKETPN